MEDAKPLTQRGDDTRAELLDFAAGEIHVHGFQAASIARILSHTGVTKGALYHHFGSKRLLGYAVLDERFAPNLYGHWIDPLRDVTRNPIDVLICQIKASGTEMTAEDVMLGCPINNLAQEMSAVDEEFRARIESLLADWRQAIADAFDRGVNNGQIDPVVDPVTTAAFVVAALEGCVGMAKNAQNHALLISCGQGLITFLESIRRSDGETRL